MPFAWPLVISLYLFQVEILNQEFVFFPKAAAKGSLEKSVVIKDCQQTLPKVLLK